MGTRKGVALIVVLWLAAILTLLVYSFLRTMLVEYSLAGGLAYEKQAEQLALSAIDKGMALINEDETLEATLIEDWSDNEEDFREFPLGDGFFTLWRPTYETSADVAYGAIDEASKININAANKEMLMKIPDMTDSIAESIIDWRDEDEEPQPNGAESSYYLQRDPGYNCKNAPFETIEELLYVKGVTRELLYGDDLNRNGVEDEFEDPSGEFKPGFIAWITVWSHEPNTDKDGEPRVDINTADTNELRQKLGDDLSNSELQQIQIYRLANAQNGGFRSVAHLLEIINNEKFKKVVDKCTVLPEEITDVPGLININTAPRKVLEAVPGMTGEMVEAIMGQRTVEGADLSNIGWLVELVKKEDLQKIANFITCRSFQFRFDAVGVVAPEGTYSRRRPFKRITAVYDRFREPSPGLVYWKDWSRFGLPYEVGMEEER